jgi:hypothetical protein
VFFGVQALNGSDGLPSQNSQISDWLAIGSSGAELPIAGNAFLRKRHCTKSFSKIFVFFDFVLDLRCKHLTKLNSKEST